MGTYKCWQMFIELNSRETHKSFGVEDLRERENQDWQMLNFSSRPVSRLNSVPAWLLIWIMLGKQNHLRREIIFTQEDLRNFYATHSHGVELM